MFVVGVFIEVRANTLGDTTELEANTFPATLRVAPPVSPAFVPTPTDPDVPNMAEVLVVPTTFMEVVAKTLGAERAFDAYAFPLI